MAKRYTRQHIKEALSYWKKELKKLDEAASDHGADDDNKDDDKKDDDAEIDVDDLGMVEGDDAESKARATPIGKFSLPAKFMRLHKGSEKLVKKGLTKLLNKYKAIDGDNAVSIENSRVGDDDTFNIEGDDPMVITVKVQIDRAKVKGFRKLLAIVKEDEEIEQIDEGEIWNAIFKGVADTAKGVNAAAKKKIDAANEELKKKIGLAAVQTYLKNFCGRKLAEKATLKNVFIGADPEGDGAEYTFCAAVEWDA